MGLGRRRKGGGLPGVTSPAPPQSIDTAPQRAEGARRASGECACARRRPGASRRIGGSIAPPPPPPASTIDAARPLERPPIRRRSGGRPRSLGKTRYAVGTVSRRYRRLACAGGWRVGRIEQAPSDCAKARSVASAPRLLAGNAPVAVVAPQGKRGGARRKRRRVSRRRQHRRRGRAAVERHRCGQAARQHALQRVGLAAIDREIVCAAHRDDARREPAPVRRRHPLGGVSGAFAAATAAIRLGGGECEIEKVVGETPPRRQGRCAKPAVVRLREGDDVLDVGLASAGEGASRIRAVNAPAKVGDDGGLD